MCVAADVYRLSRELMACYALLLLFIYTRVGFSCCAALWKKLFVWVAKAGAIMWCDSIRRALIDFFGNGFSR